MKKYNDRAKFDDSQIYGLNVHWNLGLNATPTASSTLTHNMEETALVGWVMI